MAGGSVLDGTARDAGPVGTTRAGLEDAEALTGAREPPPSRTGTSAGAATGGTHPADP